MAFLDTSRPGSTGFFLFPLDAENPQARIPHDYTKTYSVAPFERLLDPKTFTKLKAGIGSGSLHVVGLWPDPAVLKKFELIVGGEAVLFLTKDGIVAQGRIAHSDRSRQISDAFFGKGSPGTHELLLLLVGVEPLVIPMDKFHEAIGRKTRAPFKTFTTLSPEAIHKIEDRHGSIYAFFESARGAGPASVNL
ncbi:MAG: hypothetical protein HY286_02520 [Planctomycetes bacterium]|nr:hypothetical protein [Planctomycetota bacterium]